MVDLSVDLDFDLALEVELCQRPSVLRMVESNDSEME